MVLQLPFSIGVASESEGAEETNRAGEAALLTNHPDSNAGTL